MRRKRTSSRKMKNLILIQGKSQKGKGVLRKTMTKRRMTKMRIPMITVTMNQERLQKNTQ